MSDAKATFEVVNELGLHARAAAKLVQVASRYPCDILLIHGSQVANAKSVMGVLLLCGSKGTQLGIEAKGEGAEQAVEEIGELIRSKFGEER